VAQRHHGLHDGQVFGLAGQVDDEGAVDLEFVGREVLEVAQ
jgi:hypothetical protein